MDKIISHYQILSKIATGGMAVIYLALDTETDTKVAIKILKEEVSGKEKVLERFTQEGLLNLDHPNIVKILDAGVHDNTPYIVMEYIEGSDLEDLIKNRHTLPVDEALTIFSQLLSALAYVHGFGIIHRDIKPKNILIDKLGNVKLTDFGIAKSLYSHVKTSTGGYLGAPAYSSPEQMDGLALDARSDIYSLGITLYEMLLGVTPFSSTSIPNLIKEKFTGRYRKIGTYRSDVDPYIISVIEKCIAVSPKDRFGSVAEIINALSRSNASDTYIKEAAPKKINSSKRIALIALPIVAIMLSVIIILAVKLSGKADNKEAAVSKTTMFSTINTEITEPPITIAEIVLKEKMAFMSDRDGNAEIYVMNIDGTEQTRITNNPAGDDLPSFSPDGSKIVFLTTRTGTGEIFKMNTDGSGEENLTVNDTADEFPTFSPDGSLITFTSGRSGNAEIYLMRPDGSNQTRITRETDNDWRSSFSPDGSKIVFVSTRDRSSEIYTMNIDGSGQTRLTSNSATEETPCFSPDRSKIAFSTNREGNFEIYTMNVDGSGQEKLTNNPSNNSSPAFSPDGSKIAFVSDRDGNNEIYIINVDGTGETRLTDNPANDMSPSFSPIPGSAPVSSVSTAQENASYDIGSTGPAGGLIFYVNPNYVNDGWRYLEAALSDFPGNDIDYYIQWYNGSNVKTGAIGTSIGTGRTNTQKIVNVEGNGDYAAKLCDELVINGYNDWFLPSLDELNLMYENLYLNGLGNFEPTNYWSSSEFSASNAWYQLFSNGGQNNYEIRFNGNKSNNDRDYPRRARAVRAF